MNLTRPFRRRDSLAISIAILKAARHGIRKTHLLSSVSMSCEQFTKYSDVLKAHGFFEKCGYLYQTTREGLELIEEFDSSLLIQSFLAN